MFSLLSLGVDDKSRDIGSHQQTNGEAFPLAASRVHHSQHQTQQRLPAGGFLLSELNPIAVANFRTAPSAGPSSSSAVGGGGGGYTRCANTTTPNGSTASPSSSFDAEDPVSSADRIYQAGSLSPTPSDVVAMKREPPSGGSVHEDSDG